MKDAPEPNAVLDLNDTYRFTPCADVNEELPFRRLACDDRKLWAMAIKIRFTAAEPGRLSWPRAFDRALARHRHYGGPWIEPLLFPKCSTANYHNATSCAYKAFPTRAAELEFLNLDEGHPLELANRNVHSTASDIGQIVPVTLYSTPVQAWDFALDSVLGRRATGTSALMPQRNAA